jgi:hypothetical protein
MLTIYSGSRQMKMEADSANLDFQGFVVIDFMVEVASVMFAHNGSI